ncbi:MAG: nucleotidyl transferase AbiEii/AbiGii toxin family protein [Aliarcobacter sp.]|nr:nucleotidyl transferase AbiEii/AbiGii toxin family protein [Aliarcobacter sp.]MDD2887787.1 nucleotidyl transferase AbiEii/AbiGii toxin family protein [Aliarcobacter sp.]
MYDFSKQKAMLEVTLELLKENNLLDISSLGGGTALAGYYWNHRYSTDIDIFIYGNENKTHLLKPSNWSENIKSKMNSMGFTGNFRHNDIYTEIVIDKDSKIQFFDVVKKSKEPFCKVNIWNKDIQIDTIEEIIAKKIYYRGDIGNSRDLFDIAIAIHEDPVIFSKMILKKEKIIALHNTLVNISNSEELKELYLHEIKQMNPNIKYDFLAKNTVTYLKNLLENICASYNINYELLDDEYILIENEIYSNI